MENDKKVLLGMSGGTDSSVAALKLLDAGYQVIGVTFRFYDSEGNDAQLADARALAQKLDIEHFVYDAREAFRKEIISYFIDEYMAGHTPVPCTRCNNLFKWPLLARLADEMEIYWIATGHYVRKAQLENHYYIAPAIDEDKDQSFFLWGLKQDILSRILLPMGDEIKIEAREFAAQRGFMKVATKKDSLGVCFCPMDYRAFLRRELTPNQLPGNGKFVDEMGDFMGWHEGYPFYTIGQRRGLGIYLNRAVFVKEIRQEKNEVVLAPLASLYKEEMYLSDWN